MCGVIVIIQLRSMYLLGVINQKLEIEKRDFEKKLMEVIEDKYGKNEGIMKHFES